MNKRDVCRPGLTRDAWNWGNSSSATRQSFCGEPVCFRRGFTGIPCLLTRCRFLASITTTKILQQYRCGDIRTTTTPLVLYKHNGHSVIRNIHDRAVIVFPSIDVPSRHIKYKCPCKYQYGLVEISSHNRHGSRRAREPIKQTQSVSNWCKISLIATAQWQYTHPFFSMIKLW